MRAPRTPIEHDPRTPSNHPRATRCTHDRGVLNGSAVECFIADVEQRLCSDRLPVKHASMVVVGFEFVAGRNRGETNQRARFRQKSFLEG